MSDSTATHFINIKDDQVLLGVVDVVTDPEGASPEAFEARLWLPVTEDGLLQRRQVIQALRNVADTIEASLTLDDELDDLIEGAL